MAGRKPKPTKLKLLAGNPGGRPLPENEPQPDPAIPDPPDWMEGEALAEWRRIAGARGASPLGPRRALRSIPVGSSGVVLPLPTGRPCRG